MSIQRNSPAASRPRLVGRFVASQALVWMLAAPILGAAVARLAVWVQNYWAPLLIFPLLVGCGLGLLLVGLMRLGQVGHRATIWSGAVLAVAVAVAGQHYFSFRDAKAALAAQKPQDLPLEAFQDFQETRPQEMRPDASADFVRFMQRQAARGRAVTATLVFRGAAAWASWATDGLLCCWPRGRSSTWLAGPRIAVVCRSWYRTTRTARWLPTRRGGWPKRRRCRSRNRLAQLAIAFPTVRAVAGRAGWNWPSAAKRRTKVVEAWLSAAQREQVARVLDGERTD